MISHLQCDSGTFAGLLLCLQQVLVGFFWSTSDKTIFRPMLVRIFWPILVEKHHRPKSQKKLVDVDQNIPPIDVDQKTLVDVNKKNL